MMQKEKEINEKRAKRKYKEMWREYEKSYRESMAKHNSYTNFTLRDYPQYQNDKNIVKLFVNKTASDLCYASEEIRNDAEIINWILRKEVCGSTIKYAGEKLLDNEDVAIRIIKLNETNYQYLSERLQTSESLCLEVLKICESALEFLRDEMFENVEFIKKAILERASILEFCKNNVKDDKNIIEMALSISPLYLRYASPTLQNNREYLEQLESYKDVKKLGRRSLEWYESRMQVLERYREEDKLSQEFNVNVKRSSLKKF